MALTSVIGANGAASSLSNLSSLPRSSGYKTFKRFSTTTASRPVKQVKVVPNEFPHLPPYSPPSKGLVSNLSPSLIPFAELMRLHKPTGFYASFFPHMFGVFFAAATLPSAPTFTFLAYSIIIHVAGNLTLRGAACTWNDTIDAPFDRLVARCRHRPVARGAVTPSTAHTFTFFQTLIWISILGCLSYQCWAPASILGLTLTIYPFCKRITNFPQLVLGFSLGLGQTVGMTSIGLDPLSPSNSALKWAILSLYLSNVANTMIYDTVYAHQDLKDDLKAGVKSMAVLCGKHTKKVLSFLSLVEVALLANVAYLCSFGVLFWVTGVGATAAILSYMIATIRLENPAECANWFKGCIVLTGIALCTGLGSEYLTRLI